MIGRGLQNTPRAWAMVGAMASALLIGGQNTALGACLDPPGDVDQDSVTTVVDVQCTVLVSLWELAGEGEMPTCIHSETDLADRNCNGSVTWST